MPTETRCTSAVAAVIPISTGHSRKRVAKVSAISCDLSPSSATKMTAKLSAVAARKPDKENLPVEAGSKCAQGDLDPAASAQPKVSSAAIEPGGSRKPEAARPDASGVSMSTGTLR